MTPRSRTEDTGKTDVLPIRTGLIGIWCWRRAEEHQRTSVLGAWVELIFIHADTSSMQSDTLLERSSTSEGPQNRTYRSGCRLQMHTRVTRRVDEADYQLQEVGDVRQEGTRSVPGPTLEELHTQHWQQPMAPTWSMTSARTKDKYLY